MKMFLAGEWVERPQSIVVCDPEDGREIDTVPKGGAEDMRCAIDAAVSAAETARRLPLHRRMSVLREVAAIIERDAEEFAATIAAEGVKTIREARKEVSRATDTIRISGEEARRLHGETIPFDQVASGERRIGHYRPAPVGVVGAITPFNDPLNLVAHKLGPAIAGGNAVVLKPDSKTPLSALRLAAAFDEAGLPAGILQVVTGDGSEIGSVLSSDPRVRLLSFTGGRATGEAIARSAGLKKLAMELGSNAPALVLADAELALAAAACVSGAFSAAGQNCLHVQRIFVHRSVYDEFAGLFCDGAASCRMGSKRDEESDMGPLIDEAAARRVEQLVNEAVSAGGRIRLGGRRDGTFYAPTVLEDVPEEAAIAREEIYGPVTLLYAFDELDAAIDRANAVDYGLQAGIFTTDLRTAFQVAEELRYGGVIINDSSDYRIDAMPFGGFKGSGLGREGIRFALQEMTEPKLLCLNLAGPHPDGWPR